MEEILNKFVEKYWQQCLLILDKKQELMHLIGLKKSGDKVYIGSLKMVTKILNQELIMLVLMMELQLLGQLELSLAELSKIGVILMLIIKNNVKKQEIPLVI